MDSIVILDSGGINSLVAAMRLVGGFHVHFLHVSWGSAVGENARRASQRVADSLAVPFHEAQLPSPAKLGVPVQTNNDARSAEGEHGIQIRPPGIMLTMIGLAQTLAMRIQAEEIVIGASQLANEHDLGVDHGDGDRDMQQRFFHGADIAIETSLSPRRRLRIDAPFADLTRTDIVRLGLRLGAPFHLTWSCGTSGNTPCGQCVGCKSRRNAFAEIGVDDPAVDALALS